jgi:hypothetical protein
VVKNYLRTAFDKLGVWTRLELALYVASHGGASWHLELGLAPLPARGDWQIRSVDEAGPPPNGNGLRKATAAARGT